MHELPPTKSKAGSAAPVDPEGEADCRIKPTPSSAERASWVNMT